MPKIYPRLLTYLAVLAALGLEGSFHPHQAQAQDLKAELDALDELPEDDLSGFSPASPDDGSGDIEEFATEVPDAPPAAPSAPPAALSPTPAAPRSGLGLGDLDLQGLEAELKFDDFSEGGTLSAEDLNQGDIAPGTLTEAQGSLLGLDFKQLSDRVRLVARSNRPVDWSRELRSKRRQVILEMRNMKIGKSLLKRTLDTGEFEGPVALVQAFETNAAGVPSVKILFQLRNFVDPTVLRMGNELVIDFPIVTGLGLFRTKGTTAIVPKTYVSANDLREFKGGPISLNVKEADLSDVLNLISKSAGKNFVLSGTAGQNVKVTVNLQNVPWDQALSIILFNNGLGFQDLDTIYRIGTVADLQKELQDAKDAGARLKDLIAVETRIIPVNYAQAETVQANVSNFLTPVRGKISVDARTNSLVISDIPEVLEQVERYVKAIDRQTPQILIEGRIVQASEEFSRSRNFAWGLGEGSSGSVTGDMRVGLEPVAPEAGAQDNILSLATGRLGDFGRVQALLRMSEKETLIKTVASPRITVLNTEQATITQGETREGSPVTDAQGNTSIASVTINTTLNVTPQVTSDGQVILDLQVSRDTPASTSGTSMNTRSANTKMMVKSGETAVLGGMYTMTDTQTEIGLPYLRSLPVFGKLFQNENSTAKQISELIMFISPRLLNPDSALLTDLGALNESDGGFSSSALFKGDESSPPTQTF